MNVVLIVLLLLVCGCASERAPLPSPVKSLKMLTPRTTEVASAVAPGRLPVTHIPFVWDRYTGMAEGLALCYGIDPQLTTNRIFLPLAATNYALVRTNWSERSLRHFFKLEAYLGTNSSFTPVLHWPPYPADRAMISWTGPTNPTTILVSADLRSWSVAGISTSNQWVEIYQSGNRFFRLDGKTNDLFIRKFNPLNQ